MLITAIEPRRKSLRALYLDGELAVNIDAQTLLSSRFQVGTEITDEELHELLAASDANRAKEKALYLIAHRDHSKRNWWIKSGGPLPRKRRKKRRTGWKKLD